MEKLVEILQQCGNERKLTSGEVLIRQGMASDGVYYLRQGRLGVYREERDGAYRLSEVTPGEMVGELGATTGRARTATVRAEEESYVIHVSEDDFRRALDVAPALLAEVICAVGDKLISADAGMVTLDRSYQHAVDRVQVLSSEKEQLEELLRLREELADMIVHDLRNPLGVISNGLELLEHISLTEIKADYMTAVIEAMEGAVRRMRRLVDTLLDIARLESGEVTFHLLPLDLRVLVEEVMTEELPLAESGNVVLKTHWPEKLPQVRVDRDSLQRVVVNLLDNALKFTPRGGQVWVEARSTTEGVLIEVVDTGPGIPQEDRVRIFEKFTQVHRQGRTERGLGLGLAFCRMAVEAHGGRIWIEDGPEGKGVRFIFTLPTAPEAAAG